MYTEATVKERPPGGGGKEWGNCKVFNNTESFGYLAERHWVHGAPKRIGRIENVYRHIGYPPS